MKIVFLDSKTIGDDIDLSEYDKLGEVVKYDFSTTEEAAERTRDADVIVLNKVEVNEKSIGQAKNLKLVCVTATGTNNLDKEYLAKRGIEWRNVAGYSTETVAQHTFALLFYLLEKLRYYDDYVKSEKYVGDTSFTHFSNVFHQISGMTWGIVGLGNIGRRVADIAKAFGCHVVYYSTTFTTHTISVVFTKSSSVSSTYCTEKTDSIAPMTSSIAAQSHDSFTGSSSFTFTSPKYTAANKRITHQLADVK
jgi:lactate dehydrogenase-like 2-hydroxyacid dehydrogenase